MNAEEHAIQAGRRPSFDTEVARMWHTFKRLLLGFSLILAASAVLLLSDTSGRRETERRVAPGRTFRIGLAYFAPDPGRRELHARPLRRFARPRLRRRP